MSGKAFMATIRGLPDYPHITEINVRDVPGTNLDVAFKAPVGMSGLTIHEVQPDNQKLSDNNKIYQWFKLTFHGGAIGWVRDDLLFIEGDGSAFGYGSDIPAGTHAFSLQRGATSTTSTKPQPSQATTDAVSGGVKPSPSAPSVTPEADASVNALNDIPRVQKAAINITHTFEGGGYGAYNNYDKGIISYGIIQFTLAAGGLGTVVDNYLARSNSATANNLRGYADRIRAKDVALKDDMNLKNLLIQAANEPEMQQVQDELMISNYWDRTIDGYVKTRDFRLPLSYALLFDVSVNFGVGDWFVRKAEERLGVPTRSHVDSHDATEEQIIAIVVEMRKASHDRQATNENLPGLRVRGDFWVGLVNAGDWNLQGDANGTVDINGHPVQVKNP